MLRVKGNERIMVCPLGWGLGHSTRVIPIINHLLLKGCTVVFAGDKTSISVIQSRLPDLEFIDFPSIDVKLSKGKNQLFALIKIAIKIVNLTIRENRRLKRIVEEKKIDIVISDNRYGLYSDQIPSYLITHQLKVIFPRPFTWAMPIGGWFIKRYAEKFKECWIPDNKEGFRVSGELTSTRFLPRNSKFIGLLSRFQNIEAKREETNWDLLAIVSGPPPHRELFEKAIVDLSNRLKLKTLVAQGLPDKGEKQEIIKGDATLVSDLSDIEMANAIASAKFIVCRSGYSTIMDLIALNRKALLVPTPGQTEQEYLSDHLSKNKVFVSCKQAYLNKINLSTLKIIEG